MNKEIPWINIVKFLCIILIFLYHSEFYCGINEISAQFFYLPFFTNSFFFVSGYLLFKKQLSQPMIVYDRANWYKASGGALISNVLFKIAIPSIVFSTLIYFPKRMLRGAGVDVSSLLHDTLLGGSLWFTCALTVAELIAFVVLFTRVRNILWYVVIGFGTIMLANYITSTGFQVMDSNKVPWQYKSGLIAFFFIVCGGVYMKVEPSIDKYLHKYSILAILLAVLWMGLVGMLLLIGKSNLLVSMNQQLTRGTINISSIVWALFSIMVIINLCKLWKGNEFTNWVGRHSIAFYFFCGAIPNFVSILCMKLLPQADHHYVVLMVWLISLSLAFAVVYLFFKYIPWMFDFRKLKKANG